MEWISTVATGQDSGVNAWTVTNQTIGFLMTTSGKERPPLRLAVQTNSDGKPGWLTMGTASRGLWWSFHHWIFVNEDWMFFLDGPL